MDIQSFLWAVVVLLIVLGLIAASARVARALGLVTGVPGLGKRQRRLQILEVTAVDSRRRLVLVGRDDRAHLLLLGPTADLVVERDIEGRHAATPGRGAMIARLLALLVLGLSLTAAPAEAQTFTLDLGEESGLFTGRIIQLIGLLTVLSLAPSILVVVTSFTRIVVVLSLLRSALGIQQTPPNTVLVSLALFLTAFIMAPTLQQAYEAGIGPLIENEITEEEAFAATTEPFRTFMISHVRDKDLALFAEIDGEEIDSIEETPLRVLVPAFMISELRRAFEIAFLIFIPFLIIDMTVASVLMSMGMMMLPPVIVSLPFKLIFFVLLDGWYMLAGSLVQSYGG